MIISHKYKFIFIKSKKTAGTSIEVFLSRIAGPDDIVTPIFPRVDGHQPRNYMGSWNYFNPSWYFHSDGGVRKEINRALKGLKFYNHIPAYLVQKRIPPPIWNTYFKFSVERNPWDKTLSHFYHLRSLRSPDMTFDEYLDLGNFCKNIQYYTHPTTKEIMVDQIARYEHLDEDLQGIFASLGIPFSGKLTESAKRNYRTERLDYRAVYNTKQRELIEHAFIDEIELHGYAF